MMSDVSHERLLISAVMAGRETQARAGDVDVATVTQYAADLLEGAVFPEVVVFRDRFGVLHLADGFHRLAALKQAGKHKVDAEVREGGRREAWLWSAAANLKHGRTASREDRRHAVQVMLKDPEWAAWSDSEIARRCGVSHMTVSRVRAELVEGEHLHNVQVRKTSDGRTMTVGNIGGVRVVDGSEQAVEAPAKPDFGERLEEPENTSDDPSETPRNTVEEIPFEVPETPAKVAEVVAKVPAPPVEGAEWDAAIGRWRIACPRCGKSVQLGARTQGGAGTVAPHTHDGRWCSGAGERVVDALEVQDDDEDDVVQEDARGDLVLSPQHRGVATADEARRVAIQQDAAAFVAEEVQPQPHQRDTLDRYYTPDGVARAVLAFLLPMLYPDTDDLMLAIDPSVGGGAWVRAMAELHDHVMMVGVDPDPYAAGLDLVSTSFQSTLEDYVRDNPDALGSYQLVTGNPPYLLAEEHVRLALSLLMPDGYVVFVLREGFLGGKARMRGLYREHPPKYIVNLGRIPFEGPGMADNPGAVGNYNHVAIVWQLGWTGDTTYLWLDWSAEAANDADADADDIPEAAK